MVSSDIASLLNLDNPLTPSAQIFKPAGFQSHNASHESSFATDPVITLTIVGKQTTYCTPSPTTPRIFNHSFFLAQTPLLSAFIACTHGLGSVNAANISLPKPSFSDICTRVSCMTGNYPGQHCLPARPEDHVRSRYFAAAR